MDALLQRHVQLASGVCTDCDYKLWVQSQRVHGMCRYDAERGIARLQEGWVSLASAQQRRGRAGRVRPGICYKLFSRRQAGTMEVRGGDILI